MLRLMSQSEAREISGRLGLSLKKALGQNFLVDGNIARIILSAADARKAETVLEIGPGLGVLTRPLLEQAGRLIAVEKDAQLAGYLRGELPALELIEADALDWLREETSQTMLGESFKVVSNLPYSVASALITALVESGRARTMVLTVQREVAGRLAAKPGHKDYGAMTLYTQLRYHATIEHVISPRCFWPVPNVESAVVVLDRREPRVKLVAGAPFHEIVRLGFGHRRKMLRKLLSRYDGLDEAMERLGIASQARGEQLSLEQWIRLANELGGNR